MRLRKFCALVAAFLVLSGVAPVQARDPAKQGLVAIDSGSAAYYSSSYDNGGWDRIRTIQARNHGMSPSDVYDADGFYCVRPGAAIGNIITIRNARTGRTATCMVADAVAPYDQGVWWSRWVIEMSYAAFTWLGLDQGNTVEVWVVPPGR